MADKPVQKSGVPQGDPAPTIDIFYSSPVTYNSSGISVPIPSGGQAVTLRANYFCPPGMFVTGVLKNTAPPPLAPDQAVAGTDYTANTVRQYVFTLADANKTYVFQAQIQNTSTLTVEASDDLTILTTTAGGA